jgi:eukaryotic-like serine/threonine-protein kinase
VDDAIAEYHKAIDLDPKHAPAHINLGIALVAKNRLDEGIAEYKKAIDLNPKYAQAHNNLGTALQAKKKLDEAIAEYKKAIDLDPKYANAHYNLGYVLHQKNQLDEAIAKYKKAIELDPKHAKAHNNLGIALRAKDQLEDAIAEFKKAIELDPKDGLPHYNLGNALKSKNQLDDAAAEYRKAINLLPNHAETHCNLAKVLRLQGQLPASLESYQCGHALGSARDDWRYPSSQWLADAERLVQLEARLPDVLCGKATLIDNRERLDLIEVCGLTRRHAAAARLYADAFNADAKLADDLKASHRYKAACAAALAAAGQGTDGDKLDDKEHSQLRKQALEWLRADLTLWAKRLEGGQPADRQATRKMLQHWLGDTDLAAVRDAAGLQKLSTEQQEAWRELWADVAQVLKKTDGSK